MTHLMDTGHRGGLGVAFPGNDGDDVLSPSLDDYRGTDGHLTFNAGEHPDLVDPSLVGGIVGGGGQREETRRRGHDNMGVIGGGGGIIAPNRLWLYAVITASCVLLVFFSIALYISWTRCKLSTS